MVNVVVHKPAIMPHVLLEDTMWWLPAEADELTELRPCHTYILAAPPRFIYVHIALISEDVHNRSSKRTQDTTTTCC